MEGVTRKISPTQRKILENAAGREPPHRPSGSSESGGWSVAMASCFRKGWLATGKNSHGTLTATGREALDGVSR